MDESLGEHIALGLQRFLPLLASILMLLVAHMPVGIALPGNIKIVVSIACVYFWLLYRPDLFNLWSACLLGLFEDAMSAAPLGTGLFSMLLCFVLVTNLARFFTAKPLVIIWYGFGALAFVVLFAKWLLVSIYYGQFLPLPSLVFSLLMTVAAYPILSLANTFIKNTFIRDEA